MGPDEIASEYRRVQDRLASLRGRRDALVEQERVKAERRDVLEAELRAAGVNVDDLEGERERLLGEAKAALEEARTAVSDFESRLLAAAGRTEQAPAQAGGVEID